MGTPAAAAAGIGACRPSALLTTDEMGRADRLTIEAGTSETVLMDRAGSAVADHAERMWRARGEGGSVLVLCGPGNNGGDGFVAARRLRVRGVPVRLGLLGGMDRLKGAAAEAARGWPGPVEEAGACDLTSCALLVDALFGAGLARPLEGEAGALVERIGGAGVPVLAVDVPSGVDGTTGAVRGPAVQADETVTFFRFKPGHLLLPGRERCGALHIAEIGMDPALLAAMTPATDRNEPGFWGEVFPWPRVSGHKYSRGHAVAVSGGASHTGAARLSARAALRAGAGLVTLASPGDALGVNAAHLTAVMLRACDDPGALAALLADTRLNAVVLGPGLGVGERTRALVAAALRPAARGHADAPRGFVLDADALTSFAGEVAALAGLVAGAPGPVVLTPHDGEFARLFGGEAPVGSRLERARAGARATGAVMLLKGADTVVAAPDGRATVAGRDAPFLATAGSGDVLSGLVAGLLAQGMEALTAASAAVWLHAEAGARLGPGLIAEDLPEALPAVLAGLRPSRG